MEYSYKECSEFKIELPIWKFEDFRVGNWIDSYMGFLCPINGFSQPSIKYKKVDAKLLLFLSENPGATYRPIELTHELLFKCGFELRQYSKGAYYWRSDEIAFKMKKSYPNKPICYVYNHRLIEIKYLHQLQNLYHLLVKKELEIEL